MKERIQKIIARENLTAAKFADIIGVQRSSVSHILSGRNNPGLDFLNKILQHFPHISGDWLITGQGGMVKNLPSLAKSGGLFDNPEPLKPATAQQGKEVSKQSVSAPILAEKLPRDDQPSKQEKKEGTNVVNDHPIPLNTLKETATIEKVVVFYTNKTFKEYYPAQE